MATETETQERGNLQVVQEADDDAARPSEPSAAMSLLEHAHRVAEETMTAARDEAERLLMAARHDAQQMRKQAREQAERDVSESGRQAELTRARAQEEADRLLGEARDALAAIDQDRERLTAARDDAAASARDLANRLLEVAGSQPKQDD